VVIRIKPDSYAALVDQQEAALSSSKAASLLAKANQAKAEEDCHRADDLYLKKLISDADYTTARTTMEVARANYQASLANIRQTEGALNSSGPTEQDHHLRAFGWHDQCAEQRGGGTGRRTGQFTGTEVMRIGDLVIWK